MKIGVICEGHTDRVVIANILKGYKGIDSSQIVPLRPNYSRDETDLAEIPTDSFSNWTIVKKECENRIKIEKFLSIEGQNNIIVHIDSAESNEYGVTRPVVKDANYAIILRARIVTKINEWLDGQFQNEIIYAVAIEETEAWILTIYDKRDSSLSAKPKEKLKRVLSAKKINYSHTPEDFKIISDMFTKKKNFSKEKFFLFNKSLEEFCIEVENKIQPD
jgi:DNA modification methylase